MKCVGWVELFFGSSAIRRTTAHRKNNPMKVMVIVKATKNSEAGVLPNTDLLTAMMKFNEELVKAGVMLAGDGLRPSSAGKRIYIAPGKRNPKVCAAAYGSPSHVCKQDRKRQKSIDFPCTARSAVFSASRS